MKIKKNSMRYLTLIALVALTVFLVNCKKKKNTSNTEKVNTTEEIVKEETKLEVLPLRVDAAYSGPATSDAFEILSQKVEGDRLIVEVQYGGGCELHTFELISNGAYMKSLPMKLNMWLTHNGRNDMCRAMLTNTLTFDISSIKPNSGKELHLIINGKSDKVVVYKF